jgi:RNA ligase
MYIPKLEDYYKAVEDGLLSKHETTDLVGFKYNIHTTFNKLWNDVTINARGITFDKHTGEIVARPFRKFFNHSEFITIDHVTTELYDIVPQEYRPNLSGSFRVMDKLDGFLAITFYNKYLGEWQIKTGGSFIAKQSDWAQDWFKEHVNDTKMDKANTYLFEGIWSGDRHVVKYDYEALKLLAVIPNATVNELPLKDIRQAAEDMGV